jgi:uncharacterized protein (TIGR00251 family)
MPARASRDGGDTVAIYVTPRAGRSEVAGVRDDALWIKLAVPPVDGRANVALIDLLATLLGVPKSAVELVSRSRGRTKRVRVNGLSAADVQRRVLGG